MKSLEHEELIEVEHLELMERIDEVQLLERIK